MNLVENVGVMENMAQGTDYAKELENYRKRCLELEEKSKMDELRCKVLESEVENLKKKNKELEEQIVRNHKAMSSEEKGKEKIVDLTDDGNESDEFLLMMMENKALECEKSNAEKQVSLLKVKVKQLESQVSELESKLNTKVINESNVVSTPKCEIERLETGAKWEFRSQVRKRLSFEKDGCSNKKLAPSTPGFAFAPPPSCGVIDISDEDESYIQIPKVEKCSNSSLNNVDADDMDGFTSGKRKRSSNMVTSDDEDDMKDFKRKRCSNIVKSDDETSDDDNAPISTLIKKDCEDEVKEDVNRRRPLKRLRKSDDITIDPNKSGNSSREDEEDDETLGGFIVEGSESASESEAESESGSGDTDGCNESEYGLSDYKGTLDKIRRKKDLNLKWDLEGEMLADFGKDTELCMRAVCALYRQQTIDEKAGKGTFYRNDRGFSQSDAFSGVRRVEYMNDAVGGSKLAEFLTDESSDGDLNKTVEELEKYNTKGIELCRTLAAKYSKQLFEIYKNKEDPYFMPK